MFNYKIKAKKILLLAIVLGFFADVAFVKATGKGQSTLEATAMEMPYIYDYSLEKSNIIFAPIDDKDDFDRENIVYELKRIINKIPKGCFATQLLVAILYNKKEVYNYTKYLFASTGLLEDEKAQKKAHFYNYHLIYSAAAPVALQLLSFLSTQTSDLQLYELIIPEQSPLCQSCGEICLYLFNEDLVVHQQGCQGEHFPLYATDRSAIDYFYSDRFTVAQRQQVIAKIGKDVFPKLKPPSSFEAVIEIKIDDTIPAGKENILIEAVKAKSLLATVQVMAKKNAYGINAIDGDGKTALDYSQKETEVYYWLRQQGARTSKELALQKWPIEKSRPGIASILPAISLDDSKEDDDKSTSPSPRLTVIQKELKSYHLLKSSPQNVQLKPLLYPLFVRDQQAKPYKQHLGAAAPYESIRQFEKKEKGASLPIFIEKDNPHHNINRIANRLNRIKILLHQEDIAGQKAYINYLLAEEDVENIYVLTEGITQTLNALAIRFKANLKSNKIAKAYVYYTKLANYAKHFNDDLKLGTAIQEKYNEAKTMLTTVVNSAREKVKNTLQQKALAAGQEKNAIAAFDALMQYQKLLEAACSKKRD